MKAMASSSIAILVVTLAVSIVHPSLGSKLPAPVPPRQCDKSVSAQCPSVDPTPPVYLPDPSDCHSFCECSGGTAWHFLCPDHLVFQPGKGCVFPDQYPCHPSNTIDFLLMGTAPTYCPSSVHCPSQESKDVVQLPNPEDCASFCKCFLGKAYLMKCPGNLLYNPKIRVCDYPQNVHCQSNEEEQDQLVVMGQQRVKCPSGVSQKCPKVDGQYPKYLPYPGECHDFCECSNGIAYRFSCPDGLIFNPKLNGCDHPGDIKC